MTKSSELDELMTQMEVSRVPLQRSRGVEVEDTTDSSSADDVSISQIGDVHSSIFHTATTLPAGMSTPFATEGVQVKEEPSKVGTSKFVSILHQNPVHVEKFFSSSEQTSSLGQDQRKKVSIALGSKYERGIGIILL